MLTQAFAIIRARKLRALYTIIMLAMAFCLMGIMPALFMNIDNYMLDEDTKKYGLFHGIFYDVSSAELESLEGNMFVERIGMIYTCGEYLMKETGENVKVGGYDEQALQLGRIQMIEGRMPQKPGEIVLENSWRDKFEEEFNLGDTITIVVDEKTVQYTVCGFCANYRRDWLSYDYDTSSDRLPSAILCAQEAESFPHEIQAMVCVSQFNKQENPETAFKGVASTIGKDSYTYFINRNVYQNRGLNKIFGIMQRILLILPPVIAVAAAIFFALSPQMQYYRQLANRLYAEGAKHKDVILLEATWLLILLLLSIALGELLSEGLFFLCQYLTGLPWVLFSSFGISMIAVAVTVIAVVAYTKKSILPLIDATYTQRNAEKVLVAIEVKGSFCSTLAKRRKYSNRSPVFWAGLATSLVFVALLCGLMELRQGNYRLNVQSNGQSMGVSIDNREGKYTYRYGDFSIFEGSYFDETQVEALAELPGVSRLEKEYGGEIACLVFPEGYSPYAQQIERVDNIPGSESIEGIEVIPKRINVTQRGYTIWVLDEKMQQGLKEQYPNLDVEQGLAQGKCIMICPPIADSIEAGKEYTNDLFEKGDTVRFAMLSFTVPADQVADRKDVFIYREQTLEIAELVEEDIWLDYEYNVLDSDLNDGVTLIISEQTAKTLDFENQIKGFTLYMSKDCTEQQYIEAEQQMQALADGFYGVQNTTAQNNQTKQVVKAVVLYAAIVATAGAVTLLLCSWLQVYQRGKDLYEKTYGKLFMQGMPQNAVRISLLWEGLLYLKRTLTLMYPIMVFGETYYVTNTYQYGFDQLWRMISEAALLALRDILQYTLIFIPVILFSAFWFGRKLRNKSIDSAIKHCS